MIALQIQDVKTMMSQLLVHSLFDEFLLNEMNIDTATSLRLDGKLNRAWYSTDEEEALAGRIYSKWSEIKPIAYQFVKGNRTPLAMMIVFQNNEVQTASLIKNGGLPFAVDDINGLYMNLRYDSNGLTIITGTSLKLFSMDKSLEHYWDESVKQFLQKAKIAFTEE